MPDASRCKRVGGEVGFDLPERLAATRQLRDMLAPTP